jgi:hypothetical protein
MKPYYLLLIPLAFLSAGCGVTTTQSGSEKRITKKERRAEEFEKTALLVEGENYIYRVQSVNTGRGKTIQTTSPYSMKVRNGQYEATLPYFGRAYQADLGGSGGIEFNGTPEDMAISKDTNKLTITTTFTIANSGEKYNSTLVIGSNGYGTLTIHSQRRQAISYYGQISELKDSE